ncbi:response regulator transcription factor [Dermatobacter hominis]|uniref:response regulator transcription factor n=1 Tax=Dermatobacter hominis TaxID=2884263 RepID=UPI001D0F92C2|nr:response regulator transcription factor [Dermatobacter hominis]UDY37464.1 response regulator transcription factor [Dermatobacter hominis]
MAAVNDYDLVVHGLAEMLRHDSRLDVKERIVIGEPVIERVQVALFDTFGRTEPIESEISRLLSEPLVERVVVFSMDLLPDMVDAAMGAGASGFISKGLTRPEIAEAVLRVAAGQEVRAIAHRRTPVEPELDWPGRGQGLSMRESEVLVLAAEGLTNAEIGRALYIGTETVKSHLHAAYTKLKVRNRVEATAMVHRSPSFRQARSGRHDLGPTAP